MRKIWAAHLLLLGILSAPAAWADKPNLLDTLAGTWTDLDSFTTIGQCIGSPVDSLYYFCSPAQLTRVKKPRFEGKGMISATDSVMTVGDSLRKEKVNSGDVQALFTDYNYSDLATNVDLNYVAKNLMFGIKPLRYQGQFEIHSPNLPLASLTFRKDSDLHVGTGLAFGEGDWKLSAGALGAILFREESLVEASLIDLATRPQKDLVDTQKMTGYFFDVGGSVEFRNMVSVSLLGRDLGNWLGGKQSHAGRFLFIHDDKIPKIFGTLSWMPYFASGRFQIGLSSVRFFDRENNAGKQVFGTVSYYVGPLRLLSGFRSDLLRTGLAIRFSRFEVNVAQEWINKLEESRHAQPRFSLEVTSGL